ncbi:site-specific integrase, partial [Staphylococcus aureus]|nr:site-specific integrase [Staphylococcus aureus]
MTVQPSIIRDEYITYIQLERNYSSYTIEEYATDINEFLSFLEI